MPTKPVVITGMASIDEQTAKPVTITGEMTWDDSPVQPPEGQRVIVPTDLSYLGTVRLEVDLGPGGTGNMGNTGGSPSFFRKADGKIGYLMLGEVYEAWPTGHPLVEFEIDPSVPPNSDIWSAPHAKYVRTWGDIRDGHIMDCSGRQYNYYAGGSCYQRIDDNTGYLWWMTNNGYVPNNNWPELSCTVLHHDTGKFESYGPWLIDKAPHGHRRYCTGQIIQIPKSFSDAHCPGYTLGVIGQMGSGVLESPFGPSLTVFKSFDPTQLPPATACDQPPNVASKCLILHDSDNKKQRDTRYKTCGWAPADPNDPSTAYDCRRGAPIMPGVPLWGGQDSASGELDSIAWLTWVETEKLRGLLYGGSLSRTPSGYQAPGDPDGFVHHWYGNALHGEQSGSGFQNQACCHGQPAPDWGSTGPGGHFRQPMGWIYDTNDLPRVLSGHIKPQNLMPTTDAFEWKNICSGCDIHPPKDTKDWNGVFNWQGAGWVDSGRLYVPAMRDDTTGYRLPCIFVFQLAE